MGSLNSSKFLKIFIFDDSYAVFIVDSEFVIKNILWDAGIGLLASFLEVAFSSAHGFDFGHIYFSCFIFRVNLIFGVSW